MSTALRVSAVVAARDATSHLERALASIAAQTQPPQECVVVVGPSRDDTLAIARAAHGVTVVSQAGRGLAGARNLGLASTTGDVVAFLDADDEWHPDKTASQVAVLERDDDVLVVTGHMRRVSTAGVAIGDPEPALTPSGVMVRRCAFERFGPFDARFRIACDTEWLMRVREGGGGPVILPDVIMEKTVRPESLSNDLTAYRLEMLTVVREAAARGRS